MDDEPGDGNQVAQVDCGICDVPAFVQYSTNSLTCICLWKDIGHIPGWREEKKVISVKSWIRVTGNIGC